MSKLDLFQDRIATLFGLVDWKPTSIELNELARRFSAEPPETIQEARNIVLEVCQPMLVLLTEGLDNSDLRALLALAIAAARS
jgi:hypothetical protein